MKEQNFTRPGFNLTREPLQTGDKASLESVPERLSMIRFMA